MQTLTWIVDAAAAAVAAFAAVAAVAAAGNSDAYSLASAPQARQKSPKTDSSCDIIRQSSVNYQVCAFVLIGYMSTKGAIALHFFIQ